MTPSAICGNYELRQALVWHCTLVLAVAASCNTIGSYCDGVLRCGGGEKLCEDGYGNRKCVGKDDPRYGCGSDESCASCSANQATPVCSKDGTCAIAGCTTGYADQNGSYGDGCEVHYENDPMNCGASYQPCGDAPNGTAECGGGECYVKECVAYWRDCNEVFADGCETDISTDKNNCGSCGKPCAISQECQDAICQAHISDASSPVVTDTSVETDTVGSEDAHADTDTTADVDL